MTRQLMFTLVAAACLAVADARAQDQPRFRSTSEAVRVDVSVQQNGRPVTGLTVGDFELRDNGVVQRIADFSYEKLPIDVTVALDVSQSVSGETLARLQAGVVQLQRRLNRDDRLKLVTFNMRVTRLFDFTGAAADVRSAFSAVRALGATGILDTVSVLLAAPSDIDRRQLLIVFSDGEDTSSVTDDEIALSVARRSRSAITIVRPVRQVMQTNSAAAYAEDGDALAFQPGGIVLRTLSPPLASIFRDLAAETGGTVLQPGRDDNLTNAFAKVLDDFRSSYVLNFIPTGVSEHGSHALDVRVTRSGTYAMKARKTYVAD